MKKNILFIYANSGRIKSLSQIGDHSIPDTPFWGYNNISHTDYNLSIAELGDMFSPRLEEIIRRYFGFNQSFFFYLRRVFLSDYVVSPVALNVLAVKLFFGLKRVKWIVFNINLTNVLRRHKYKKIFIFLLKKTHKIVCLSHAQIDFLISVGVPTEKMVYVPFGVDQNYFKPVYTNDGYILSVGRDNGRNYANLIEAVRGLAIKVIIVCSKRNLLNTKDIPDNVEIRYDVNIADLKILYEKARLVVVPAYNADYLDGSDCSGQTVILDAMACGKPVIATYRDWMSDYLEDGVNSFLVEPENPTVLRNKILEVYGDENRLLGVSKKARADVELKFNTQNLGLEMAKLFSQD